MSYKKWLFIRISILVLIIVGLSLGITFYAIQESKLKKESDEKARKIAEILEPLREERKQIQTSMNNIISELKTGKYSEGTIMYLVTDTDARLYTEVYRLLKQTSSPGLIAIDENYPGDDLITPQELRSLESSDWSIIMKGNKNTDFDKLSKKIESMNIKKPDAIYFEKGAFDESLIPTIKELEIKTIIAYDEIIEIEGINYSYEAYGYKESDFSSFLGSSIDNSETIAITVGYNNTYELYDNGDFSLVLNQVDGNIAYELVSSGNLRFANTRYDSLNLNNVERKKELLQELDNLQEEYDDVQRRIEEVSNNIGR